MRILQNDISINLVDFLIFLSYESKIHPQINAKSETMARQSRQQDGRIRKTGSCVSRSDPVVKGVEFNGNHLTFGLSDGHRVAIHLLFYPKLLDASELQRKSWKLIAGGKEVHWADIGQDISVTGIIALQEERYLVDTWDV